VQQLRSAPRSPAAFDAIELRAFLFGSAQIHERALGPLVERLADAEIFTVRVLRRQGGLDDIAGDDGHGDGQLMRAVTARKVAHAFDALDAKQRSSQTPRHRSSPSRRSRRSATSVAAAARAAAGLCHFSRGGTVGSGGLRRARRRMGGCC